MTVAEWLQQSSELIPRLDAELILSQFLLVSDRSWLAAHPDMELPDTSFIDSQVKRRAKNEPLAYILGWREFYGRRFYVNKSTLIPRVETEDIIDIAIAKKPTTIIDVGTGSGCIAITLALELPDANIIALDISKNALEIAQKNAKHLGAKVDFRYSDLLENCKPEQNTLIIANLPYVNPNWNWLDKSSLAYEPDIALYSEQNGLEHIFRLIKQVPAGCSLILECDPSQHDSVIEYAKKHGLALDKKQNYILSFS